MGRLTSIGGYKLTGFVVVIASLAFAGISMYWLPKPIVNAYDRVPRTEASSTYHVQVNGADVPVQLYPTPKGNVSFARFAFSNIANVIISVSEPISRYVLSPKGYNIAASVSGNTMSFTLDSPQYLVLRQVNRLREELFLLADAPEVNPPQLGGTGVTDALSQPGVSNSGQTDAANGLNTAISKLSAAGGGTLYLPSGVYLLDHGVQLKSNVHLYLAPGAVLQLDANYPCCLHNQGLISIEDAVNAKLDGRGIINGNAMHVPTSKRDFHMITTENVQNLEINDVLLLDQGTTAVRLVDAHNSAVRNLKAITNHTWESDGIDFDSSDNILVDNAFIYSTDDSTSQGAGTGVRHTVKDNYNLTVQNSVLYQTQTGAAFKIGTTDPQNSIHDILYNNINIVSCIQMAAFYPTFGANIENVSLRDIRAEVVTDRPFEFHAIIPSWSPNWNGKIGFIHGIKLTNIVVDETGARHSDFVGFSTNQDISDVTFTNFRQNGILVLDAASAQIETNKFSRNISFQQQ